MNKSLLKLLLDTPSVSGDEENAISVFSNNLKNFCDIRYDDVGNCYALLNPSPDKKCSILIEAHIDEIGFQVVYIDTNGFVYMRNNGGIDKNILPGSHVVIHTQEGKYLNGIIGQIPIHLKAKQEKESNIKLEDLWIDTGLHADKVKEIVNIGDYVSFKSNYVELGDNRIVSKGLDNKIGVFIIMEVLKELSKENLSKNNISICGVASVQEEIGCKGSQVIVSNVYPEEAIIIDLGFATDMPSIEKKQFGDIALGKGVMISCHPDSSKQMKKDFVELAKANDISYQLSPHFKASGGTDTPKIQLSERGLKTILLSIPNRYMHTQVEMCDYHDIDAAISLIVAYIKTKF